MRLNLIYGLLLAASASFLSACGAGQDEDQRPLLVATTGQIHDALQAMTEGVPVDLRLLCGPGVDPHSYSATTRDVKDLSRARAVIYNGFHLEAQLGEALEVGDIAAKAWSMASAFPSESVLEWVEDGEVDPDAPHDPHIWNHLPGWGTSVSALGEHVAGLLPDHADAIRAGAAAYVTEITEADRWAAEAIAALPANRRVLVSGHDAFQYFARRYGMQTLAVLGVGNDAEPNVRKIQEIAGQIVERDVPVVFLESITSSKIAEKLVESCVDRGAEVRIADDPLYSDDLGDQPPVDTFLGAFRTNVETIVRNLGEGA